MSVHRLATVAALWIDHVVLAVEDLGATTTRLAAEHGLGSYAAHPPGRRSGLVGRIVPCGSGYLHLLAAEDAPAAAAHRLGTGVLGAVEAGRCLLSWAVATDDIDAFVRRTGRRAVVEEVAGSDGALLWRLVAGAEPAVGGAVPAIVCWGQGQGHPEAHQVEHRVDPGSPLCPLAPTSTSSGPGWARPSTTCRSSCSPGTAAYVQSRWRPPSPTWSSRTETGAPLSD